MLPLILFSSLCLALSYLLVRSPRTAALLMVAVALMFPWLADTSDWSDWFSWVKRYSVVVPVLIFPLSAMASRPRDGQAYVPGRAWTWVFYLALSINVLEAGLFEIESDRWLNGLFILALAAFTPSAWSVDAEHQATGFVRPVYILAFTATITHMYVFNRAFENVTLIAITVVFLAVCGAWLHRDMRYWFIYRAYTLYFAILLDSFLPEVMDHYFYPEMFHPPMKLELDQSWIHGTWLAVNGALMVAVAAEALRLRRGGVSEQPGRADLG